MDQTSMSPIPGVAVYNSARNKITSSDFDGKVSLSKFLDDELIFFQHISFLNFSALKKDIPSRVFLRPKELALDEVVISASKFKQSEKEVPQSIISIRSEDILLSNPQRVPICYRIADRFLFRKAS